MHSDKKSLPITQLLSRLWHHISLRHRGQFGLLLILMCFASFAEILSIGAVLPFLGVMIAPERVFEHPAAQPIIQVIGLTDPSHLLLPLTLAFCATILIAGAIRLFLLWTSTLLIFAIGADISFNIYRRTLFQTYAVHCSRNSSEVVNGISGKVLSVIYQTIEPTLRLISSGVMLVTIFVALLMVEPVVTLSAFFGFGLIYVVIITFSRKHLLANSDCIARESTNIIKSLQEGLGGIREVLINGSQAIYCEIYRNADLPLRRAQGINLFIGQSPRYGMEALGTILIATLAYSLIKNPDGRSSAIPILGALAMGAQRLLPLLQQAYSAWASIRGGQASLKDTLELLDQPLPDHADQPTTEALPFTSNIRLKQIGFRYAPGAPYVLKQLDLTIAKGSRIGFIGTTGSGKSTLLDIVMGLLEPTDGMLEVDGQAITHNNYRNWQAHIAHVPQVIFLADCSIEENIAFGVPKDQIDHFRVRQSAQQAQIADSIETWPKQYKTFVGERGIRLSGGQRQRIGIARALYKQTDVIIFDEATSALDNETEQSVMQAIEGLSQNLTILIIAHRISTLKNCSQIFELEAGCIKRSVNYQDIFNQ